MGRARREGKEGGANRGDKLLPFRANPHPLARHLSTVASTTREASRSSTHICKQQKLQNENKKQNNNNNNNNNNNKKKKKKMMMMIMMIMMRMMRRMKRRMRKEEDVSFCVWL